MCGSRLLNTIHRRVRNDGELGNTKGCNLPGKPVYLPAVCEKDIQDILFGVQQGVDFIALSFVRTAADVALIKDLLAEQGAPQIQVISKIESQQGLGRSPLIRQRDTHALKIGNVLLFIIAQFSFRCNGSCVMKSFCRQL